MDLPPQSLVEFLAKQHEDPFAALRAQVEDAYLEVIGLCSNRWPDPAMIHGSQLGTALRGTVHDMEGKLRWLEGSSLTASKGPNLSVKLSDGHGTVIRVCKYPTDHRGNRLVPLSEPVRWPEASESPPVGQMRLDDGMALSAFSELEIRKKVGLYALWWADVTRKRVEGFVLAAVADMKVQSRRCVLAVAELPPAKPGLFVGTGAVSTLGEPDDDFELHIKKPQVEEERDPGAPLA